MKKGARVLAACAWAVLTFFPPGEAAAQAGPAAVVEEIRGPVFWRRRASA